MAPFRSFIPFLVAGTLMAGPSRALSQSLSTPADALSTIDRKSIDGGRGHVSIRSAVNINSVRRTAAQHLKSRQSSNSTSSTTNGGLDSLLSGFLDAFSCVGNASELFAGFSNLLNGIGADTTLIDAFEIALFGNFTPFITPAFFLGVGAGEGVVVGLNATNEAEAKVLVNKAILASGASPDGINGLAQEFGRGLVNVSLPAIWRSNAENFFAGLNLSELVAGVGIGFADGMGTALKPVVGADIFNTQVDNSGYFTDPKGAGSVTYSFARGLATQLSNLGLGVLGISDLSGNNLARRDTTARIATQDRILGGFLGHRRAINFPGQSLKAEYPDTLLTNSSRTNQVISSLAQSAVTELSCKGVGGAASLLSALISSSNSPVPTIPNLGDARFPSMHIVVRNGGNLFEFDTENMTGAVNGASIDKLIGLIAAHGRSLAR
jgi:hypothetical protein